MADALTEEQMTQYLNEVNSMEQSTHEGTTGAMLDEVNDLGRSAPKDGGPDLQEQGGEAFMASFSDSLSYGVIPKIANAIGGAVNAGIGAMTGDNDPALSLWGNVKAEYSEAKAYDEELARQNPVSDTSGGVLGAIVSGSMLAKGALKMLGKTTVGNAALATASSEGLKALGYRVAGSGVIGAADELLRSDMETPVTDMAIGAAFGVGGQAVFGELLPVISKLFRSTATPREISEANKRLLEMFQDGQTNKAPSEILNQLEEVRRVLGPDATTAQLNEALTNTALNLLPNAPSGAGTPRNSLIRSTHELVESNPSNFIDNIQKAVGDSAVTDYSTYSAAVDSSRSALSTQYDEVFKNSSTSVHGWTPDELMDMVNLGQITPEGTSVVGSESMFTNLIKYIQKNATLVDGSPLYVNGTRVAGDAAPMGLADVDELRKLLRANIKRTGMFTNADAPLTFRTTSAVDQTQEALTDALHSHSKLAELDGLYADSVTTKDAFDLAGTVMSGGKLQGRTADAGDLLLFLEKNGHSEMTMNAMRAGAKSAIVNMLQNTSNPNHMQALAAVVNKEGTIYRALENLFGKSGADYIVSTSLHSSNMSNLKAGIARLTSGGLESRAGTASLAPELTVVGANATGIPMSNAAAVRSGGTLSQNFTNWGAGADDAILKTLATTGEDSTTALRNVLFPELSTAVPDAATTMAAGASAGVRENQPE